LAISPTALFLSRTLNGEVALAAGVLMVIAGFFNWAEDGRQRWLFLAAIGLALALTSGPMIYSMVIVFGLIILIKFPAFKALVNHQMSIVSPQGASGSSQTGSECS
jgi:predicted membrane-bound mannosyltransferase